MLPAYTYTQLVLSLLPLAGQEISSYGYGVQA